MALKLLFSYPVALISLIVGIGIGWAGAHFLPSPGEPTPVSSDLGADLLAALAEASPSERLVGLAQALERVDAGNLDRMIEVIDRERTVLSESEIQLFFEAWARFEPLAALEHPLNERWPARTRVPSVAAAMERWALSDPIAAREFVDRRLQAAPKLGQKLIHPFVSGWAHSGAPGAFEYILEIPVHVRPTATLALVASQARRLGVEGLLSWADARVGRGDEVLQRDFFRRVTKAAARRDPAATGAWVLTHVDREYAVDGVRLVAERWFPDQPDEAFAWVTNETPEPFHERALNSALSMWTAIKLDPARRWLERQTLGPAHDPMVDVFARQLAKTEGEEAIGWAERIHDPEQRSATLGEVATLWVEREPQAAERWLAGSSLDDAARAAIRSASKGARGPTHARSH
jgi:hypothetical protein